MRACLIACVLVCVSQICIHTHRTRPRVCSAPPASVLVIALTQATESAIPWPRATRKSPSLPMHLASGILPRHAPSPSAPPRLWAISKSASRRGEPAPSSRMCAGAHQLSLPGCMLHVGMLAARRALSEWASTRAKTRSLSRRCRPGSRRRSALLSPSSLPRSPPLRMPEHLPHPALNTAGGAGSSMVISRSATCYWVAFPLPERSHACALAGFALPLDPALIRSRSLFSVGPHTCCRSC